MKHNCVHGSWAMPRLLAVGALALAATLSSAWAADAADGPAGARAQPRPAWTQHRQDWVRAKLDNDANRLEIKASQQAAWQEYAQARTSLALRTVFKAMPDADAAAMAKMRADRAADSARKLAELADATAKLQVVLSAEQRQTLAQIAREGHCRHGHRGWHRGPEGLQGGRHGAWQGAPADGHGDGHGPASEAEQVESTPPA